jgi:hypothetical protein
MIILLNGMLLSNQKKEESLKKQKENKTLHQKKWRSNKNKIKLLESIEGNESENHDSETSNNNTNN